MTRQGRTAPPHAWKPGTSGNPAGRKAGTGTVARLRVAIAGHVPAIVETLKTAALQGDVSAARLLLERVIPPLKAIDEVAPLSLPNGTLTEQGRAVVDAVAAGYLAPAQGAALLASLGALAKLVETDELVARVTALEAGIAQEGGET